MAASLAVAVAATAVSACGSDDEGGSRTIAATTGVTADIAARVAGPNVDVEQIVPDGASPHDFELSAQDRATLEEADLVVATGAGLEAGIPLDDLDVSTWQLTDNAGELDTLEETEDDAHAAEEGEEQDGSDPHVWMDPTRVAGALPSLADSLAEVYPNSADAYRRHARDYARRLRSLDREIERILATVPARNRELVTSHDSLAYFADRYEFDVAATAFPSTGAEAEASAGRLRDVVDAVQRTGVPTVFAQEGDDPQALRLVAEQTGVDVNVDLLVEAPSVAGSYKEMLRGDAELIAESLRG